MSFDLCEGKRAQKPYFIENIRTNIYSIEELCYYLYENPSLIDETIVNEQLCDWLRDELGLRKLHKQMMEHLEKRDGIVYFIAPVFKEIGYLQPDKLREYQEQLVRLEMQSPDTRQKQKGDYLVRRGMYAKALNEYRQIIDRQTDRNTSQFMAQIWNNMGSTLARLFRFEEAADCFYHAWDLVRTRDMLRKYVSVLPLFLSESEYLEKLDELKADPDMITRIQEYNVRVCEKAEEDTRAKMEQIGDDASAVLSSLKEEYCRGAQY